MAPAGYTRPRPPGSLTVILGPGHRGSLGGGGGTGSCPRRMLVAMVTVWEPKGGWLSWHPKPTGAAYTALLRHDPPPAVNWGRGSRKQPGWPQLWPHQACWGDHCSSLRCVRKNHCHPDMGVLRPHPHRKPPQGLWPPWPLGPQSAGPSLSPAPGTGRAWHGAGPRGQLRTPHVTGGDMDGWPWGVSGDP